LALTAPDSWGFLSGSTLYGGIVNGFDGNSAAAANNQSTVATSYYVGATVATPVTGLRAGASFDLLDIAEADNDTFSVAGYLSYQATEKLSFHGRAEYYKDRLGNSATQGAVLFADVPAGSRAEVLSLTGTVQYDLWKNVISRLELRWDHSLNYQNLFDGTSVNNPTSLNAWMLAANVIYKF
jgi:hypothetical protein